MGKVRELVEFIWSRKKVLVIAGGLFLLMVILILAAASPKKREHGFFSETGRSREYGIIGYMQKGASGIFEKIGVKKPRPALEPKAFITAAPAQTKYVPGKLIVTQTYGYFKKYLRDDGFYEYFAHHSELCTKENCSVGKNNIVPIANMWVILGRVGYYERINPQEQVLDMAEKDAAALLGWCKEKEEECALAAFPILKLYKLRPKEEYLAFINKAGKNLLAGRPTYQVVQSLGMKARVLVHLFEFFGDERYLEEARSTLVKAQKLKIAEEKKYNSPHNDECYLTLAESEIGRAGKQEDLLAQAAGFLTAGEYKKVPQELTLIQPCIDAAFILGGLKGGERLIGIGEEILSGLVKERWDGPGIRRQYEEGGFIMGEDPRFINITDTGYMAYLLSLSKNLSYKLVY
jgi:hypothetical protein